MDTTDEDKISQLVRIRSLIKERYKDLLSSEELNGWTYCFIAQEVNNIITSDSEAQSIKVKARRLLKAFGSKTISEV
jgi:hypothetical protein